MNSDGKTTGSTVIPCLRYRDPVKAIDWLCQVFGFEKHLVAAGEGGVIHHAQLTLGAGMIMIGGIVDTPFGRLIKQPEEIGGKETQAPYLMVADADQVYARVREAGGRIEMEIRSEDYGGRGFTCRDLEGHVWSVGSYDPWAVTPDRR